MSMKYDKEDEGRGGNWVRGEKGNEFEGERGEYDNEDKDRGGD